uniref:Uncharacterized protein n=1 Tax=Zea mays TaxID=4577 RepID=C0PMG1_MAIZE|nr:unknown [Zea mays]
MAILDEKLLYWAPPPREFFSKFILNRFRPGRLQCRHNTTARRQQREAVAHLVLQQGAGPEGEGLRRGRGAATAAARAERRRGGGELQHELVQPVHGAAPAQPQGAAARGVRVAARVPDHGAGAGGGRHVVALVAAGGAGPPGPALLRLHLLGRLRLLQRRVRVPAGAPGAGPRARLGDVRALVLLPGPHRGGPAHGARPAHRLHRRRLPHGGAQPVPRRVRAHARRRPGLRPRRRRPRPRRRRTHDGRQARVHAGHRHHARIPPHRRLLRAQRAAVHGLDQVHLLHLLLLPPAHRRAVQRTPQAPAPTGGRPRRGWPRGLRRRARRHVLRLPPAGVRRAAPRQEMIHLMISTRRRQSL